MNKEYAMQILETVERGTLESTCSLAKEAFRYLERLKSTTHELNYRIYKVKYNGKKY